MGFLKNLFCLTTVADLFQIDIYAMPDAFFIYQGMDKNIQGDTIKRFTKKLNYKEAGLFDILDITQFEDNSINFNLKSSDVYFDRIALVNLLNKIALIKCADENGNKTYSIKHVEAFEDNDYMLYNWPATQSKNNTISIWCMKGQGGLKMSVSNIRSKSRF